MAVWDWRRGGADAAVATAVVMDAVGGRGSLLGTDPALSDLFLMPSLPPFSAWRRVRWGLEGGAACLVMVVGGGLAGQTGLELKAGGPGSSACRPAGLANPHWYTSGGRLQVGPE